MAKATTKAKTTSTTKKTTARKTPTASKAKTAAKAPVKAAAKTAAKPKVVSTPPLSAPSPVAAAPKVSPVVVKSSQPAVGVTDLRKEQLLDEVAKRSGAKRKDVKPIVEAALAVLGEAIGEGQDMNLKPLGKVKVARTKQVANGRVINVRVRQSDMVIQELEGTKDAAE